MEKGKTYVGVEGVAIKVPSVNQFDRFAFILGPGAAVCQWSKECECNDGKDDKYCSCSIANRWGVS
jgi:hypothetical protein